MCGLLEKGWHISKVCDYLGVRRSTCHNWLKRGEEEEEGIYTEFYEAVNRAKSKPYGKLVDTIMDAVPTDPKLALDFLKVRYPAELGKIGYPNGDDDPSIKVILPIEQQAISQTNILAINLQEKLLATGLVSQDVFANIIKRVMGATLPPSGPIEEKEEELPVLDATFTEPHGPEPTSSTPPKFDP